MATVQRSVGGVTILAPLVLLTLLAKIGKPSCLRMRANKECKARITREIEARESAIASLQMKLQKVTEELKIVKLKGNPYQAPDHLLNRSMLYIFYSIKQEIRSFGKRMVATYKGNTQFV